MAKFASSIVSLGWVRVEIEVAEGISDIGYWGGCCRLLGWVRDGVEALEVDAIEELSSVAYYDTKVASSAVSLDWVMDGIAAAEVELIEDIVSITNNMRAHCGLWTMQPTNHRDVCHWGDVHTFRR